MGCLNFIDQASAPIFKYVKADFRKNQIRPATMVVNKVIEARKRLANYLRCLSYDVADQKPTVGDRVKLSPLGAQRCPGLAAKVGKVVKRRMNSRSVMVLFDGNRTPTPLHRDYIEPEVRDKPAQRS